MLAYRLFAAEMDTVPDGAFQRLAEALGPDFQPCLGPARDLQAGLLGVEPQPMAAETALAAAAFGRDEGPPILGGEIYSNKSSLLAITVEAVEVPTRRIQFSGDAKAGPNDLKARKRLSMFYMGPAYVSGHIQTFKAGVEKAFNVALAPKTYRSKNLTLLREEGRAAPEKPGERDLTAALVLTNRSARALANAARAAGGLLSRDLARQLPADASQNVDDVRRMLERAGLVGADIVVVCSRTQAQVARVPSRDVLQHMAERGVRCGCGRAINEERAEESVSLTEYGNRLMDGNRWLAVLLVRELLKVGVSLDDMLVEQQPGGDAVDCIADIGGELVFFQATDQDVTLEDAYAFGAKLGVVRAEHSVIMSTRTIGADAREHFEGAHKARRADAAQGGTRSAFRCIEGVENLGTGIEELAAGIYQGDALRFLRRLLPMAGLKPQPLIHAMEQRASRRTDGMPEAAPRPVQEASVAEPALA